MKVKEVEQIVGIARSNIRFYEDEGLIHPKRNANNYREYSKEDVQLLLEIKKLRLLGISIQDIKSLFEEKISLETVFQNRLEEIKKEEDALKEMKEICEFAIANRCDVHELDQIVLDEKKPEWKSRLDALMQEDLVEQKIDKKKLNMSIMCIYVVGTLVSLAVMFLARGKLVDASFVDAYSTGLLMVVLAVSIFIFIAQKFTSSMKSQVVLMIIAIINQPLFIFEVASLLMRHGIFSLGLNQVDHYQREVSFTFVLLLALMVYVILIWVSSLINKKVLQKKLFGLGYSIVFAFVVTMISHNTQNGALLFSENVAQFAIAWFYGVAVALIWIAANADKYAYNMYHAVCAGVDLLNVQGVVFDLRSRYGSYNMRRTDADDEKIYKK